MKQSSSNPHDKRLMDYLIDPTDFTLRPGAPQPGELARYTMHHPNDAEYVGYIIQREDCWRIWLSDTAFDVHDHMRTREGYFKTEAYPTSRKLTEVADKLRLLHNRNQELLLS